MTADFAAQMQQVALAAMDDVLPGMRIGLGTGRAAEAFIRLLGERVGSGLSVVGVPTSERSAALAKQLGIPLSSLDDLSELDVAFDGADEVDPGCRLTKGRGGAMLRERVVASEAKRFVVLITEDKLVDQLGEKCPLPVEIVPFALASATRRLATLGEAVLRQDAEGQPYRTDNGNRVIDLSPARPERSWSDPEQLDRAVRQIPGVIDTGFFFGVARRVLVGSASGVREISPCS